MRTARLGKAGATTLDLHLCGYGPSVESVAGCRHSRPLSGLVALTTCTACIISKRDKRELYPLLIKFTLGKPKDVTIVCISLKMGILLEKGVDCMEFKYYDKNGQD